MLSTLRVFWPAVLVGLFAIFCGIRACQALSNLGDQIAVVDLSASGAQSKGSR